MQWVGSTSHHQTTLKQAGNIDGEKTVGNKQNEAQTPERKVVYVIQSPFID